MFSQSPFVGPGTGSLASHSMEILIMLLGAFVLGYVLSQIFAAKDRARIAKLEAQMADLIRAGSPAAQSTEQENNQQVNLRPEPVEEQTLSLPDSIVAPSIATPEEISRKDDLKRIKGIGPNIEIALNVGGIATYQVLALANEQSLRQLLVNHDPRLRMHDPKSWPALAALARDGKWQELDSRRKILSGKRSKTKE